MILKFIQKSTMPSRKHHTTAACLQVLALIEAGVSSKEVVERTQISRWQIKRYQKMVRERGFDPAVSKVLKEEYVLDAPKSGRRKVCTEEIEQQVLETVWEDHSDRKNIA
jgi:DNA-binding CsgD family transcriptional regulator